jgi:hypothetical protein
MMADLLSSFPEKVDAPAFYVDYGRVAMEIHFLHLLLI